MRKTVGKPCYATPKLHPTKPHSKKRQRTSELIIDQFAADLIGNPTQKITLSGVANRCGVARATVYRLFANTSELLWALLHPHISMLVQSAVEGNVEVFLLEYQKLTERSHLARAALQADLQEHIRLKVCALARDSIRSKPHLGGQEFRAFMGALLVAGIFERTSTGSLDLLEGAEFSRGLCTVLIGKSSAAAGSVKDGRRLERHSFPPAVSISESLSSESHIISMIDGRPYKELTRHIRRYGFDARRYRECFRLPDDYPMTAPALSERRRKLMFKTLHNRRNTPAKRDESPG